MSNLLKIEGLNLYLKEREEVRLLKDIDLEVAPAQIVAVVGESGSGKSLLSRSILGLINNEQFRMEGQILYYRDNNDITITRQDKITKGKDVSIIFQEPLSYLNPSMKMGNQIAEPLLKHSKISKKEAISKAIKVLESIRIKSPESYMKQYPHELSGGMAQKGFIAMSVACSPSLLVADEPTSALDIISQTAVLEILNNLCRNVGISIIFITHDLGIASIIADKLIVMGEGQIVETGTTKDVINFPKSIYTKKLLESVQMRPQTFKEIETKSENVLIELKNVTKYYSGGSSNKFIAVDNVSLKMFENEILGIFGESGCGKSTLAKMLTRIIKPSGGSIIYKKQEINTLKNYPKNVQIIFQDPRSSLDPRLSVEKIISEGLEIHKICKSSERKEIIKNILKSVGLGEQYMKRLPHELSGGQRQRVNIARALVLKPHVLICDEPTSHLDTVSQAQVIKLLVKLKLENKMSYFFISHNLNVLYSICDRIAIMYGGRIVEIASVKTIAEEPLHPYTIMFTELFNNTSMIKNTLNTDCHIRGGDCCTFHPLCTKAIDICSKARPELKDVGNNHFVWCHL